MHVQSLPKSEIADLQKQIQELQRRNQYLESKCSESESGSETGQTCAPLVLGDTRHQQLMDAMPMIVWLAKPDGELEFLNQRFYDYTGQADTSADWKTWQSCLRESDLQRFRRAWKHSVSTGKPYTVEFQLKEAGGSFRWFKLQSRPLYDQNGVISQWCGTAVDIHENRVLHEESSRLAERLQTTLEGITAAFFTLDCEWRFTFLNSEAEQLLQGSRDILYGQELWGAFPEIVDTIFYSETHRAMAENTMVEFEIFAPSLQVWLEVRAYPSREGLAVYLRNVTARHQQQEQLRLLENCVSRLNDIVLITEAEPIDEFGPRIVFVNDAFVQTTGYSREEVLGRSPQFLQGPASQSNGYERIREALQKKKAVRQELIHFTKSGDSYWVESDLAPVFDSNGVCTHLVAIERDISERKQREMEVRQSTALLQIASRMGRMGAWSLDLQSGHFQWSAEARALHELDDDARPSIEDLIQFYVPEDRSVIRDAFNDCVHESKPFDLELRFVTETGKPLWVRALGEALHDEEGRTSKVQGAIQDISHVKQAERSLRESEERFRKLLQDVPNVAIHSHDSDGVVQYWNRAAENFYGYPAAEALGSKLYDLIVPQDLQVDMAASIRRTMDDEAHIESVELELQRRDGSRLTVYSSHVVLRRPEYPPEIFCIEIDLSERKRLEQQFLRAQRMESIGTLAGGIAHDLNNVFGPILLSMDLLKMGSIDPESRRIVETVTVGARRGADMIRQLLAFARGMGGRRIHTIFEHIVSEVESIVNETFPQNITFEKRLAPDLWPVLADPTQLYQVMLNLLINARDAMPDGGKIILSASNQMMGEPEAGRTIELKTGPNVCIGIRDTGSGIPADILDKIFDPFFTTKEPGKGTGLGLSTTLAIVEGHGGTIQVSSKAGEGTTFSLEFPAVSQDTAS